jgi:hypothetical protein
MDPQERVERRLDRAAEQEQKKRDRRDAVLVAIIALIGVILTTAGSIFGAKWGAQGQLAADSP